MTASKIVKNSTLPVQTLPEVIATAEAKRKELLGKLEIIQAKAKLV